jgi:hypothetical protein
MIPVGLAQLFEELAALERRRELIMSQIKSKVSLISLADLMTSHLQQKIESKTGKATLTELHGYLQRCGYEMYQTSLHKYFNASNRVPDTRFLELFADFIHASPEVRTVLLKVRDMAEAERKSQRRKPGARKSKSRKASGF